MALTVEDGSIVPNADSYISLTDARTLAANYGWELPVDDTAAETALRNGAGYIGLQEPQLCGTRVSAGQSLAFPRQGITLYGFPFASDAIPPQVKLARTRVTVLPYLPSKRVPTPCILLLNAVLMALSPVAK